jgi:beta-fructofuranosidase
LQAIPRTVWLDSGGRQLRQWPVEELNKLRGKQVGINNQKLIKEGYVEVKGITAAQVRFLIKLVF